jgi:glycosyltransferase involved in cell wall biosynthesis
MAFRFWQLGLTIVSGPKVAVRKALGKIMRRLMAYGGYDPIAIELLQQEVARQSSALLSVPKHMQSQQQAIRYLARLQADSTRTLTRLIAKGEIAEPVSRLKASVILPVHNRAEMVAQAIESVLAQSGVNFELIVVDDGSIDDLDTTLEPFLSHPAMRFLRIDRAGVSVARNKGVASSCGEIVVYLDSDNRMYPGYLSAVTAAYTIQPEAQCAAAAMLWDDGDVEAHLRHDSFSWAALLDNSINIDLNCFSHRRALVDTLGGFDETLTKHSDYDLVLRYTRHHPPLRLNAMAAHYRHSGDYPRISNTEPSLPNYLRIHAKHRPRSGAPLRVLTYCHDCPQLFGSCVDTEIDWFTRQGVEIEVLTREAPRAPPKFKVPVHSQAFESIISSFKPDIIHCHSLLAANDAVTALAYNLNIPVTVRGNGFEYNIENLSQCEAHPAVKSIYLFPHFACSLLDHYPKVRAVSACFNSTRFYPRLQRDRRLVLRAGTCLATNDLGFFFQAAALCPEHKFVLALASIAALPELPGELRALNQSLNQPVDIRIDVQYDEMAELTAKASIYLHTFGFGQCFGMPVSIAEALACGTTVLARDCVEARSYAGPDSFYYNTAEDAAAILRNMTGWDDAEWKRRATSNANFAYSQYADDVVLPHVLEDWRQLVVPR